MPVALPLHHHAAQEHQPPGLAHQLGDGIERLVDAPCTDELGRQIQSHRRADIEHAELVAGGKQRDVDQRQRDRAMDIIAEIAVLARRNHPQPRGRATVRRRRIAAHLQRLDQRIEARRVLQVPGDPAITQRLVMKMRLCPVTELIQPARRNRRVRRPRCHQIRQPVRPSASWSRQSPAPGSIPWGRRWSSS